MDEARAEFGWTTYAVMDQKRDFLIVLTTAGEDTTVGTTKTCLLSVPVLKTTVVFSFNVHIDYR